MTVPAGMAGKLSADARMLEKVDDISILQILSMLFCIILIYTEFHAANMMNNSPEARLSAKDLLELDSVKGIHET